MKTPNTRRSFVLLNWTYLLIRRTIVISSSSAPDNPTIQKLVSDTHHQNSPNGTLEWSTYDRVLSFPPTTVDGCAVSLAHNTYVTIRQPFVDNGPLTIRHLPIALPLSNDVSRPNTCIEIFTSNSNMCRPAHVQHKRAPSSTWVVRRSCAT